jgi:hypothetical protein
MKNLIPVPVSVAVPIYIFTHIEVFPDFQARVRNMRRIGITEAGNVRPVLTFWIEITRWRDPALLNGVRRDLIWKCRSVRCRSYHWQGHIVGAPGGLDLFGIISRGGT